jgi:phosphoribosylformylglycinamidine synthase
VLYSKGSSSVENILSEAGIQFHKVGEVLSKGVLEIQNHEDTFELEISKWRDIWFRSSYLLDIEQSGEVKAKERFDNYKSNPLKFNFPKHFTGKLIANNSKRPQAAIIREKGSNSEREMAYALYLAGFDVRDVHMTDLVSGRENLEDVQFLGAVGGFSNSDVLGSAKGWAGAFKYNALAKKSLENFFARPDTLSIGICNGCQLFVELGLIYPNHSEQPKMLHNDSHKHESIFTSVEVQKNETVMFSTLAGATLGVWNSNGEGKFQLPLSEDKYKIVAKYGYDTYPSNPNGSDYNTGMLSDESGRHVVTMPHIERSIFQWQWANYPNGRKDEVSPWLEAFVNAKKWLENK